MADKYLKGTITDNEENILHGWYMKTEREDVSWNDLTDTRETLRTAIYEAIQQKIAEQDQETPNRMF